MKKGKIFRAVCLLLCIASLSLLAAACGGNNGGGATTTANGTGAMTTAGSTSLASTTLPPTTLPPTTPFPTADPSLPYFQQMDFMMAQFGFQGGTPLFDMTDETTLLGKFGKSGNVTVSDVDLTGENVPFQVAKLLTVTGTATDFWTDSYSKGFSSTDPLTAGDIYAGCVWIKDGGGGDPSLNPAQAYLAVKTATDNYGSEGSFTINPMMANEDGTWKQVWFYGEVAVDETKASNATLNLFVGYGPQDVEIGGLYIMLYPANDANYTAEANMPYSF